MMKTVIIFVSLVWVAGNVVCLMAAYRIGVKDGIDKSRAESEAQK
uniref:Uncharacterized protein n=1 Tax=viral metagenome TaxID=1070528 RepID=A0A6M3LMY6_9ZZZZ